MTNGDKLMRQTGIMEGYECQQFICGRFRLWAAIVGFCDHSYILDTLLV